MNDNKDHSYGHTEIVFRLLELAQVFDKTDDKLECLTIVNDMKKLIDSYMSKLKSEQFLAYHKWYLKHRKLITNADPKTMVGMYLNQ